MTKEEDLIDYDDEPSQPVVSNGTAKAEKNLSKEGTAIPAHKGSYVGIHSTGFRDFLLKAEIIKALTDCGFEHPSQVQQECLSHTILGTDCICQAKSGMGKTAIFVITVLQQIEPVDGEVYALILCHTRELAFQIKNEFVRFSKYLPDVRTGVFYGGTPLANDIALLNDKSKAPHIVVGTPGRIFALVNDKALNLKKINSFIMDECDRVLESDDMRRDVQEIFRSCPRSKQVMMFTATLNDRMKDICKKFLQNPLEIYIDDEAKLTLHGLTQYYIKLEEKDKSRTLVNLLDSITFNQVVVFVRSVSRALILDRLLTENSFPSIAIHSRLPQASRISVYEKIKKFDSRILISTDIFARGVDFERINLVINYDMPEDSVAYLHRVGRAGRFGTTGKAISLVASESDQKVLEEIQSRFEVAVTECEADKVEQIELS